MIHSHMANRHAPSLDDVFAALADPTRRAVIARLGRGAASVSELADPHDMALPSFLKHLNRLEASGIVRSRKDGRVRVCTLHPEALAAAETWIEQQKRIWSHRLDRLEALVDDLQRKDPE